MITWSVSGSWSASEGMLWSGGHCGDNVRVGRRALYVREEGGREKLGRSVTSIALKEGIALSSEAPPRTSTRTLREHPYGVVLDSKLPAVLTGSRFGGDRRCWQILQLFCQASEVVLGVLEEIFEQPHIRRKLRWERGQEAGIHCDRTSTTSACKRDARRRGDRLDNYVP